MTQSALSHQIKTLENYYQVSLFLRNTKPLRLTPAGYKLLELAQRVLPEINATAQALHRFSQGSSGRLYITIECHVCFDWLIPVLNRYRQQWPE